MFLRLRRHLQNNTLKGMRHVEQTITTHRLLPRALEKVIDFIVSQPWFPEIMRTSGSLWRSWKYPSSDVNIKIHREHSTIPGRIVLLPRLPKLILWTCSLLLSGFIVQELIMVLFEGRMGYWCVLGEDLSPGFGQHAYNHVPRVIKGLSKVISHQCPLIRP